MHHLQCPDISSSVYTSRYVLPELANFPNTNLARLDSLSDHAVWEMIKHNLIQILICNAWKHRSEHEEDDWPIPEEGDSSPRTQGPDFCAFLLHCRVDVFLNAGYVYERDFEWR